MIDPKECGEEEEGQKVESGKRSKYNGYGIHSVMNTFVPVFFLNKDTKAKLGIGRVE